MKVQNFGNTRNIVVSSVRICEWDNVVFHMWYVSVCIYLYVRHQLYDATLFMLSLHIEITEIVFNDLYQLASFIKVVSCSTPSTQFYSF